MGPETEKRTVILGNDKYPSWDAGWTVIPRQPLTPDYETITPTEALYVQHYREHQLRYFSAYYSYMFTSAERHQISGTSHLFRRFGPYLSSKAVRYAVILFSDSLQGFRFGRLEELRYQSQFFKYTLNAINGNAYAELAYACFAVCMYEIQSEKPVDEIAKHYMGFLLAFTNLAHVSATPLDDLLQLKFMSYSVFHFLVVKFLSQRDYAEILKTEQLFEASGLMELLRRTIDLGNASDHGWVQEMHDELRLCVYLDLVQMDLRFRVVKKARRAVDGGHEIGSVAETWGQFEHLETLISKYSHIRFLNHIQSVGDPPYREGDKSLDEGGHLLSDLWIRIMSAYYSFRMSYFLLFEDQRAGGPQEVCVEQIALTVCRLVRLVKYYHETRERKFLNTITLLPSLFLAGLVLLRYSRPDGNILL